MADLASIASGIAQQYADGAAAQNTMNKAATDAEQATMADKAALAAMQGLSAAVDATSQAVSR
jgi:hypothetical protein